MSRALEEVTEGVLAVTLDGELLFYNDFLRELFSQSLGWDDGLDEKERLKRLSNEVERPEVFVQFLLSREMNSPKFDGRSRVGSSEVPRFRLSSGVTVEPCRSSDMEIDSRRVRVWVLRDRSETERLSDALARSETSGRTADEARRRFFSVMGSALRGALTAQIGLSQLFAAAPETRRSPELQEYAHELASSTEQTSTLISQLLLWAQSELGELRATPKRADLLALLKHFVSRMYSGGSTSPTEGAGPVRVESENETAEAVVDTEMLLTAFRVILPTEAGSNGDAVLVIDRLDAAVSLRVNTSLTDEGPQRALRTTLFETLASHSGAAVHRDRGNSSDGVSYLLQFEPAGGVG